MELSPQSAQGIDKLLNGATLTCGNLVVGPLEDKGKKILSLLVKHRAQLQQTKGASQAKDFRKFYKELAEVPPQPDQSHQTETPNPAPRKWRLEKLTCQSIRGIAPPGQSFEFDFGKQSRLIIGPNGSGKSSLCSAVIWVLTGGASADTEDPSVKAPLYKSTGEGKAGEWDVIRTLPNSLADVPNPNDGCYAQIELRDENDCVIYFKRELANGLFSSVDLVTWQPCRSLDEFGISALDLQLSLTAPATFGRKAIETAEDTRSLLSMMLGYDDLEVLGELASNLARNRTSLFNDEMADLTSKWSAQRSGLETQLLLLSEGSEPTRILSALAAKQPLKSDDISQAETTFSTHIATAEQALAQVLGIVDTEMPPGLADKLTALLLELETGTSQTFPGLVKVSPTALLPAPNLEEALVEVPQVKVRFENTVADITEKIAARHAWWVKESASGSKASLLLKAANFYDAQTNACPVCEQPILDANLRAELVALHQQDQALAQELKPFFSDLTEQIKNCMGEALFAAASSPLIDRLQADWDAFRRRLDSMGLATVVSPFDVSIRTVLSSHCQPQTSTCPNPFPQNPSSTFVLAAAKFQDALTQASRSLDLLDWSGYFHQTVSDHLKEQLCGPDAASLLARLSAGKEAAAQIRPLSTVRKTLQDAVVKIQALEAEEADANLLLEMENPLSKLKNLSKYAAEEVKATFAEIKEKTVENWKLLYPEQPTGMIPFGLSMKKGKDKSVEGLLSGSDYTVPLHFFANAGWQRAMALSFYYAMLERHPLGLNFYILDDPILSLDDEHRERWANKLLQPSLANFQVVLASHQKIFLNNCRHHFAPDCSIELNPRVRKGRITWNPGHHLLRAHEHIQIDSSNTANMLRQYEEYLLMTVDAYSGTPFWNQNDVAGSLNAYRNFTRPHPLAQSGNNVKICTILSERAVTSVLNPGSHTATQSQVTHAMVQDCLTRLDACDTILRREIEELEENRLREMRSTPIPSRIIPFPSIPESASWNQDINITVMGGAAARSGHYVVDLAGEATTVALSSGSALLVTSDTLDPIAKKGQWVIVGDDLTDREPGALAAVNTPQGRYLRRVWPDREHWILQSVNPIAPIPSLSVPKISANAKRIVGVIYKHEPPPSTAGTNEWLAHGRGITRELTSAQAINVIGDSLTPIALRGQRVLIDQPLSDLSSVSDGILAVVETEAAQVGLVIKRIFFKGDQAVLLSPNPVDAIAPLLIPKSQITRVWPLRGVLFEAHESSP